MAGRKKGTPKTGGRKVGSENKIQAELRGRIKLFLDDNFDDIKKDFGKLEPEKRIALYEKLLNYVIAKKTDVTSDGQSISPQMPTVIIKTKKNGSH